MSNKRLDWFKSQVGKTIWRTKTRICKCSVCESAYTNGLFVVDKAHAGYLFICEEDGLVDKYFETKEERDSFENQ